MTAPANTIIHRVPEPPGYVHTVIGVYCERYDGYRSSRVDGGAHTVFISIENPEVALMWAKGLTGQDHGSALASGAALQWEFRHRGWVWVLTVRDPEFTPVRRTDPGARCAVCDKPYP